MANIANFQNAAERDFTPFNRFSSFQGVQFQATVWDSDPITYGGSDIIDVISLDINDAVMPGAPPQTIVINGFYDIATLNFSYQVTCDSRFYGDSCQHFNNCPSEDVCGLNGTCIDGQDSYSCQCSPGFSGENCDVQIPKELLHIDSCIGVNCSGNGQCKNGTSSYTCICDLGFTGENCALNIDDCMNNSCSGNGVCFDGVNSFSCECDSGYTGELCDSTVTSGCSSSHCTNGSCRLDENSEPVCSCDPGYTGERCHIDIDDCSGVECGSNYRCMDRVNSYDCICDFGHIGTLCEPSTEGCSSKVNGGS